MDIDNLDKENRMQKLKMSLSDDEYIRYNCDDNHIKDIYFKKLNEIKGLEDFVEELNRDMEIDAEQVYFAKELIEDIQKILRQHTTAKEIKSEILAAIEHSYFEP